MKAMNKTIHLFVSGCTAEMEYIESFHKIPLCNCANITKTHTLNTLANHSFGSFETLLAHQTRNYYHFSMN